MTLTSFDFIAHSVFVLFQTALFSAANIGVCAEFLRMLWVHTIFNVTKVKKNCFEKKWKSLKLSKSDFVKESLQSKSVIFALY